MMFGTGKNGARGNFPAGFPLAGPLLLGAAMLDPASGAGAEESGRVHLQPALGSAIFSPQAVIPAASHRQDNTDAEGTGTDAEDMSNAEPVEGCRPELDFPSGDRSYRDALALPWDWFDSQPEATSPCAAVRAGTGNLPSAASPRVETAVPASRKLSTDPPEERPWLEEPPKRNDAVRPQRAEGPAATSPIANDPNRATPRLLLQRSGTRPAKEPASGSAGDAASEPAGSIKIAASHSADTELQSTSGWRERNDPESWFRGAPVTEPPAEEDGAYPKVQGYSELNLEYDRTLGEDFDDTLVNIRSDILQEFSPTLFLAADVWVVIDGEDDGLRTYNTDIPFEGVYIRKLKLQKQTDEYALFGGKFEPGYRIFGFAPIFFGNYSTDLNLEERAGIGGALFLKKQEDRRLRLTAQAFYLDKSRLSGELFSGRARDGITEGQVGDTGNLDNFFLSLDGGAIDWNPGLRYSLGVGRQRPGDNVERVEHSARGAAYYIHRLSGGGDLEFSADLLRLENAGGFNEDNESITLGGGFSNWPAYAGLAYSVREVEDFDDGGTRTDRIIEVVLRKGITESTLIEAAYQYAHEWHEVQRNFGIIFRYYGDWRI